MTRRSLDQGGYRGPGLCSVCRRADAVEVDALLGQKTVALSVIAQQFGIGRESLRRHYHAHLSQRLRTAAKAHQGQPATDILDRLKALHAETREILAEARASNDRDSAIKAIARLERQLELEGKLLGVAGLAPASGTTINVLAADPEAARRALLMFARRHVEPAPALSPSPIETTVLEPASASGEPIEVTA